jgi:hypothetical protein
VLEKRQFGGGMNMDVAENLMPPNQYRYALNFRNGNSEKGAVGTITNVEGNVLVSITLPAGGNKVIGVMDDEPNDRVIYIVYNTGGFNKILAYNYKEGLIQTILSDYGNLLDLNPNYLITGIDVQQGIDGESYLLFTDDWGEPKNINIGAGIRTFDTNSANSQYTYRKYIGDWDTLSATSAREDDVYKRVIIFENQGGLSQNVDVYYRATTQTTDDPTASTSTYVPSADWQICPAGYIYTVQTVSASNYIAHEWQITNIVKPPITAPSVQYNTKANDFNYLTGSFFQFKYQYITADERESGWSPISTFQNPRELSDGLLRLSNLALKTGNALGIVGISVDQNLFKEIRFAVRRVNDDKKPEDWYLFDIISNNNYAKKQFYSVMGVQTEYDNTQTLTPINQNSVNQLFSWVPRNAKAQTLTQNRLLYANFKEGYPITLDGVHDINTRPPAVNFYERTNPFFTTGALTALSFDQGTSAWSAVPANGTYSPLIVYNDSVGYSFPAAVRNSTYYSITVVPTLSIRYTDGGLTDFGSYAYPAPITVSVVSTSTTTSTLLDQFVTAINQIRFEHPALDGSQIPYLSAESALSGGTNYLRLTPAELLTVPLVSNPSISASSYVYVNKVQTFEIGSNASPVQSFKRGSTQNFGVVYGDNYGRVSSVVSHPSLNAKCPWWLDASYSAETASGIAANVVSAVGQRFAQISLQHDAQSWATWYSIVKTLDNGIDYHVSFPLCYATKMPIATSVKGDVITASANSPLTGAWFYRGYVRELTVDNAALTAQVASLGGQELIYISLQSLQNAPYSYNALSNSRIQYEWQKGDRIRACYNITPVTASGSTNSADYYPATFDAEITTYLPEFNVIAVRPSDFPQEYVSGATSIFASARSAVTASSDTVGLMFEIYRPSKIRAKQLYYEMFRGSVASASVSGDVRYFHSGNVQSQTSAQAAVVRLENGDVFLKPRTYTVAYVDVDAANSALTYNYFVEEANYYDKRESTTWGAGRPNTIINGTTLGEDLAGAYGEIRRPTSLRYSQLSIPERGINGVGTFYDIDIKQTNPTLRSIQALSNDGNAIIAYHENAVGSAWGGGTVARTLDGNNITIESNTPISDFDYYANRPGVSTNPESIAINGNRKYFSDVDQGQFYRLSLDGATPLANKGMNKYLKEVFREMQQSSQKSYIYGAYDKRFDEYVAVMKWTTPVFYPKSAVTFTDSASAISFTLPAAGSGYDVYTGQNLTVESLPYLAVGGAVGAYTAEGYVSATSGPATAQAVTMVLTTNYATIKTESTTQGLYIYAYISRTLGFNERLGEGGAWSSFYSYPAENLSPAGIDFTSFRAGKIYIHNDYDNPASFYGTDYPSYLDIVSNPNPDQIKIWKTIGLKGNFTYGNESAFSVPIAADDTTRALEVVGGGVTTSNDVYAATQDFVYKEQQLYAPFLRTGSGASYSEYIEGDKVRGYWIKTRLKIAAGVSKIYKILEAAFEYIPSNYTR